MIVKKDKRNVKKAKITENLPNFTKCQMKKAH